MGLTTQQAGRQRDANKPETSHAHPDGVLIQLEEMALEKGFSRLIGDLYRSF